MNLHELWISFDENRFSLQEIQNGYYPDSISNYRKSALDFCHQWLNGKDKFDLQTSGSTGTPKKIEVTRDQLRASSQLTALALGLQKNATALVCLDTRYIAGVMMLVRSLEVGMNIKVVEPSSNPFEKIESDLSIDFTAMVPLQLETILKSDQKEKLNQIKIVLIGGAALNHKTIKDIEGMKCLFYATYGMTETLSHIALQKLNGPDARDYFESLPGITLTQDDRGCLTVLAPHLSDQHIVTNDLVEFVTPSRFHWLGRVDNVINTGGVKIIPEKVEVSISLLLDELAITNRFFVAALPDTLLGESVNLFFEGTPLPRQTEVLIQNKIKQSLTRFERPKSIRYITKFINTETGKINKIRTITSIQS
jgi:o-succinylbenzoate---CoA ligase